MTESASPSEEQQIAQYKQQAAERAVEFIQSGMVVGLGTGSTATFAVQQIGTLIREGRLRDIVGIPSSREIGTLAQSLGIPLTTLEEHPAIDLTIDGADEVDPQMNLIKGGGGALLHEKIVAQASRREIIIVDDSKPSPVLGTHHRLPVEVVSFGWAPQAAFLESLGAQVTLRRGPDGAPFISDSGNTILDCAFGPIAQPAELAARNKARTGVVDHGLFLGLATDLIVAGKDGVRHTTR
ncbi:MAG: ribose-5-phosphate isomerase RpiA [Dehalococcoidia bacterium]